MRKSFSYLSWILHGNPVHATMIARVIITFLFSDLLQAAKDDTLQYN